MTQLYKTYYINLDHRVDRKTHMENLLMSLKLDYERHSAFKPQILNFKDKSKFENWFYEKRNIKTKIFYKKYQNELLGIIGCLGSYIQLLEKIHLENPPSNQYIIILEDDASITKYTLKQINNLMNDGDFDIDILRINPTFFQNAIKLKAIERKKEYVFKIINNTYYCGGTHINVIPINKIDKIINYLKKSLIMPIDSLFSFNYINSYFLMVYGEKSFNEELRLINDIPKEKKPINKQVLNYNYNRFC